MLVKILKAFPYSEDGIHSRNLAADSVEDIRDDLIIGLMEEGYVGDAETADLVAASAASASGPAEDQPSAGEPHGAQAAIVSDEPGDLAPKPKRAPKA